MRDALTRNAIDSRADPIVRDQRRHVVGASQFGGEIHHCARLVLWRAVSPKLAGYPRVCNHVGQSVGAKKNLITVEQLAALDVEPQTAHAAHPERLGDDVMLILSTGGNLQNHGLARVVARDGVVARQLYQLIVAKQYARE